MMIDLKGFKVHKGDNSDEHHLHGFHVHEFGDMSEGCSSTGRHFNPFGVDHGAPNAEIRHPGDFGNIRCDNKGVVMMQMNDSRSTLIGHHNIIGRAMVIHANEDDMGLGGAEGSKRGGNAGPLLACCVIVRAKPHGHWDSHVHDHSGDHHHDVHGDHGNHTDHKHGDHGGHPDKHGDHGDHAVYKHGDHGDHEDHKHGDHGHGDGQGMSKKKKSRKLKKHSDSDGHKDHGKHHGHHH